jgi:hypothetical protein
MKVILICSLIILAVILTKCITNKVTESSLQETTSSILSRYSLDKIDKNDTKTEYYSTE